MVGKAISGNWEMGNCLKPQNPAITRTTNNRTEGKGY